MSYQGSLIIEQEVRNNLNNPEYWKARYEKAFGKPYPYGQDDDAETVRGNMLKDRTKKDTLDIGG
ncbi:MAG: hypothetical protein HPY53_06640 [Brevinematales bacterium]|nr:hypothetical protein [Brevinematales bacterium]